VTRDLSGHRYGSRLSGGGRLGWRSSGSKVLREEAGELGDGRADVRTKHYRHPLVGDLTLDCDTWDSPDGSGQRLMIVSAEPGTPSHDRLRILTSWNAEPLAAPGAERRSAREAGA
jgi:hypothetical protein